MTSIQYVLRNTRSGLYFDGTNFSAHGLEDAKHFDQAPLAPQLIWANVETVPVTSFNSSTVVVKTSLLAEKVAGLLVSKGSEFSHRGLHGPASMLAEFVFPSEHAPDVNTLLAHSDPRARLWSFSK